ncbi:ChaN family lipoprotein [Sediminimonas qiaohouensis]|nr:ChaN family lipoprotein [Sediminimonas qiaohouensis]
MRVFAYIAALLTAAPVWAGLDPGVLERMRAAQVVILGEVHDNPAHHAAQARAVTAVQPAALVFEMLTQAQAARVTPDSRGDALALARALNWAETGWPDFTMYHPIFTAAPGARVYGAAVPRAQARAAMQEGVATYFGGDAGAYGLREPLPQGQQDAREAMQMAAHCDALPEAMLPGMVGLQRLRDAELARAALRALDEAGAPVVVITGNGHARRDWGVPAVLERVRPEVSVFALGQGEAGVAPEGGFDAVRYAAPAEREDPCAAFQ